jgi:hypothetical protein
MDASESNSQAGDGGRESDKPLLKKQRISSPYVLRSEGGESDATGGDRFELLLLAAAGHARALEDDRSPGNVGRYDTEEPVLQLQSPLTAAPSSLRSSATVIAPASTSVSSLDGLLALLGPGDINRQPSLLPPRLTLMLNDWPPLAFTAVPGHEADIQTGAGSIAGMQLHAPPTTISGAGEISRPPTECLTSMHHLPQHHHHQHHIQQRHHQQQYCMGESDAAMLAEELRSVLQRGRGNIGLHEYTAHDTAAAAAAAAATDSAVAATTTVRTTAATTAAPAAAAPLAELDTPFAAAAFALQHNVPGDQKNTAFVFADNSTALNAQQQQQQQHPTATDILLQADSLHAAAELPELLTASTLPLTLAASSSYWADLLAMLPAMGSTGHAAPDIAAASAAAASVAGVGVGVGVGGAAAAAAKPRLGFLNNDGSQGLRPVTACQESEQSILQPAFKVQVQLLQQQQMQQQQQATLAMLATQQQMQHQSAASCPSYLPVHAGGHVSTIRASAAQRNTAQHLLLQRSLLLHSIISTASSLLEQLGPPLQLTQDQASVQQHKNVLCGHAEPLLTPRQHEHHHHHRHQPVGAPAYHQQQQDAAAPKSSAHYHLDTQQMQLEQQQQQPSATSEQSQQQQLHHAAGAPRPPPWGDFTAAAADGESLPVGTVSTPTPSQPPTWHTLAASTWAHRQSLGDIVVRCGLIIDHLTAITTTDS